MKRRSPYAKNRSSRQGRSYGNAGHHRHVGRRSARHMRGDAPVAAPRGNGNREKIYIYGRHALEEALMYAPQAVRRVFLSSEMDDGNLRALVKKAGIVPGALKSGEMASMVGRDTVHQGVVAIISPGAVMAPFDHFMKSLEISERTILVLLDELTDPHNVGAIIRSAAAFGAAGVLIPAHNQAPITGTVVKSSAGMAFRIPLVAIGNVNQAVDALKKAGFKTYGLIMGGETNVAEEQFEAPALVIVGNEGEGIREHTLSRCDVRLRIPMESRAESLNASVSTAVVLYQWSVKHPPHD